MSTPYIGEIRLFGFNRVPAGWLACDGSLQPISVYDTLFILIGTAYGGDGENTFGLPDLSGRVPLHQGTGPGLSTRVIGEESGTETVVLTSGQMPSHSHAMNATTAAANATAIGTTVQLGAIAGDTMYVTDITGANGFATSAGSTSVAGGSQPHDNLMPTLTLQYCIATNGIFPQQN